MLTTLICVRTPKVTRTRSSAVASSLSRRSANLGDEDPVVKVDDATQNSCHRFTALAAAICAASSISAVRPTKLSSETNRSTTSKPGQHAVEDGGDAVGHRVVDALMASGEVPGAGWTRDVGHASRPRLRRLDQRWRRSRRRETNMMKKNTRTRLVAVALGLAAALSVGGAAAVGVETGDGTGLAILHPMPPLGNIDCCH
ncbi:MAG: hypothetical protein ACFCVK_04480 [Acidimicrobiales bacterium]